MAIKVPRIIESKGYGYFYCEGLTDGINGVRRETESQLGGYFLKVAYDLGYDMGKWHKRNHDLNRLQWYYEND
jgi:hypothetical protein